MSLRKTTCKSKNIRVKNVLITLALAACPAFAVTDEDSTWVFILTGHSGTGALIAVDTEGPFTTKDECEAVGIIVTKRVYEVVGDFQPDDKSGLEWDKLSTSCEEIKKPYSENTY